LAVTRDTANGCNKIVNWPGVVFFDWIDEPFYVINSGFISFALGAGLTWCLTRLNQPADAVLPIVLLLSSPFFLLSTLENCSPFGLISKTVLRSLGHAALGWIIFYLETAALTFAATLIIIATSQSHSLSNILLASVTATVAWLVYFRLLGRLALFCTDRMEKKAQQQSPE
jgi:hypothetical protein